MSGGVIAVSYGFAVGVILMTFVVWLPSRAHYRRQLSDLRDIRRIEAGFRMGLNPEATVPLLDDAGGAFAAAKAAYLPIYPGRGVPDPAWLAWIEQGGQSYERGAGRTHVQGVAPVEVEYRPAHSSDEVAAEPGSGRQPSGFEQAVWGTDWFPRPQATPAPAATPVWGFSWAWYERLLVPLVLGLVWTDRPGRYPWWQRLADRGWETGVVFEVSALRVNRRMVAALDDLLEGMVELYAITIDLLVNLLARLVRGLVETVAILAEAIAGPVDWVRRRATRRRTPSFRPKRYYQVEEG